MQRCEKCGTLSEKGQKTCSHCHALLPQGATFYAFTAQGEGIAHALGQAQGAIGGGIRNADAWKGALLSDYPGAQEMAFEVVEDNQWDHPDVGFVTKDTSIDLQHYLPGIKTYLTETVGISDAAAAESLAALKAYSLCITDAWHGTIRFGVPVKKQASAVKNTSFFSRLFGKK